MASLRLSSVLMLVATLSIQLLCSAARPLSLDSVSSSKRELLQAGGCPAPMTQCFTTPYQQQYFCCDSSQNLDCSGGPDFQCRKFLEGGALVPASLIPDIGLGPKTPEPTPAPTAPQKASADVGSVAARVVATPAPTDPPQNPAPTNPPQNPAPTNPPQNPAPTNPPQNPAPTNPPQNPAPTNPPVTVASAPGGWTTGIATFFGGPGAFTGGNCGFGGNVPANDMIVALPNHLYYNGGCGTCLEVKCVAPSTLPNIIGGVNGNACSTDKSIIVYASDRCPECDDFRGDCTLKGFCPAQGGYNSDPSHGTHIDIGRPAWELIGKINAGIITVAFRQVACPPWGQLGLQN